MTSKHSLPRVLLLALPVLSASRLHAQTSPPPAVAISILAARIAAPLQAAHVTKVIFADLKGPNGEVHPAGRWLADQLANTCSKDFSALQVILRPANDDIGVDGSDFRTEPAKSQEDWARRMGASVYVSGTFAKLGDGIGITLTARTASEFPRQVAEATGLIPVLGAISSLSPQALPAFPGGAPRAGLAGTGMPICIYCPSPKYSKEAKAAKFEGAVTLQVTVTMEGRATDISVVKDPGKGMAAKAVEAVREWRFRPATGPDGKLVAVLVPIEVTFRFY